MAFAEGWVPRFGVRVLGHWTHQWFRRRALISSHETKIFVSDDKRTLTYRRKFSFGNKGSLVFSLNKYSFLKELFEGFHNADAYAVSLRQE